MTLGTFVIGTSHLLIGGGSVIYFFFTEGEVLNMTPPPPPHTHIKQVEKNLTPSDKTF